jgi:predicted alpha/beta-fold hydrolase
VRWQLQPGTGRSEMSMPVGQAACTPLVVVPHGAAGSIRQTVRRLVEETSRTSGFGTALRLYGLGTSVTSQRDQP